jgi:transcriptional regulator with XRE-family HTH domain
MGILRIKEIMGQKGVSREELAKGAGVSKTTISNICSETNYPSIELLPKLAKALDVDVRELFTPTKSNVILESELKEATELIAKVLKLLKGNK